MQQVNVRYIRVGSRQNLLYRFIQFFVLFGFIFTINFGPINTRHICALYAMAYLFINWGETAKTFNLFKKNNLLIVIYLFVICFFISLFNLAIYDTYMAEEVLSPLYFLYEILYIIVFSVYCVVEYKDKDTFIKMLCIIFIIQAIAVLGATVNYNVRMFLYEHFYSGDDRFERTIENGSRIMGIGLSESLGSIICSTAVAALTIQKIGRRINDLKYWILTTLFILMTLFIGRTGVLVEIIVISMVFFLGGKVGKNAIMAILALTIIVWGITKILSGMDYEVSMALEMWITDAFKTENQVNLLKAASYHVPSFYSDLFFGTNILRGPLPNGDYIFADSGYPRTYCGIGIVGAILYYVSFYVLLFHCFHIRDKRIRLFLYALSVVSFAIEFKEPFFMKYIFAWMIVSLSLFQVKEERIGKAVRS